MRHLFWIALALLAAVSASAAPSVTSDDNGFYIEHRITFRTGDTTETAALEVRGLCDVRVQHAGSGTVELWQVPLRTTTATSGTQVGSDFTTSTTTATALDPGTLFVKAIATTASPDTLMVIHCSNTQVSSSGGSGGGDWLVGGENGVTDAANPNDSDGDGTYDDPIICTLDPATCIFQTSAGQIYFATSSNQVDETNWSLVNETPLLSMTIDWAAGFTDSASYSGCMEHRDDLVYANANAPACTSDSAQFGVHRRFRLTRVTSSTFQGEGNISGSNGCDGRITEDDGGTAVTGAEWQWPNEQSHAAIAEEVIDEDTVTGVLNPGTGYQIQWKDGTNCANGGSCDCGVGIGYGMATIWGFYE